MRKLPSSNQQDRRTFLTTLGWTAVGMAAAEAIRWSELQAFAQDSSPQELPTSGELLPEMAPFDQAIQDFVLLHQIPGASVAVTDQGRLVLARGYGFADRDTQEPVTPESRFRIASVSKPVTAIAVMTLVQQGKLDLQTPFLEILDLSESIESAGDKFDERQRLITVRHLLEHRGGWDRDASFDPMFRSVEFAQQLGVDPPAGPQTVIAAMMRVPLDFAPGEKYAYSNYGYCLLGRIIEKIAGVSYEAYVKSSVLDPLKITSMQIGATRREDRKANEVSYYHSGEDSSVFASDLGQPVPSPYGGWYLEAMDAHGGWISNAIDLARLAVAVDHPSPDSILDEAHATMMMERPDGLAGWTEAGEPKETYYGLGWMVRPKEPGFNLWHSGSLPGTSTVVIRRHDGRNFIALLNTRQSLETKNLGSDLDRLMHAAAAKVEQWPIVNLFES